MITLITPVIKLTQYHDVGSLVTADRLYFVLFREPDGGPNGQLRNKIVPTCHSITFKSHFLYQLNIERTIFKHNNYALPS